MKVLIVALITMLLAFSTASKLVDAEQLVEGIIVGAFGKEGHQVRGCILDGEVIFKDIEKSIKHFESALKDKDLGELTKAIILVGEAIKLIPNEIKECEDIKKVVKDVEKIIVEFEEPEALVAKIAVKFFSESTAILGDIAAAVKHFESKKYEHAGEDIGDLINILLISSSVGVDKAHEAIYFLEGFFKGTLENGSIDLETCLTDSEKIVDDIESVITAIENDPLSHVEELFLDLIQILADIPKSVEQCKVSEKELLTFAQWANDLKDIKGMAVRFYQAFLKYPVELTNDFKTAIDSFKSADYYSSGFSIGDVLNTLFVKVNTTRDTSALMKSF